MGGTFFLPLANLLGVNETLLFCWYSKTQNLREEVFTATRKSNHIQKKLLLFVGVGVPSKNETTENNSQLSTTTKISGNKNLFHSIDPS
jgi:hypothetical protein